MPELRTDWLTSRAVLIAENRADRPNEFDFEGKGAAAAGRTRAITVCPFCPGNEAETPPANYEQLDDENRWRVRIIPNKYPALTETAGSAFGVHEVIIETARHVDRTSFLSEIELRHVLQAYSARLRHWSADDRLAYGLVFKNQGPRAGASLAHLHSQLIALPAIPAAVSGELRRAEESHAGSGSCVYCRLIKQEREAGVRVIYNRDDYIAFCPFASLHPCEVWLMPMSHNPSFERPMSDDSLDCLARLLRALIVGIESLVPSASFNLLIRTAPWRPGGDAHFHWRIELQPRMNAIAGLEAATGIYINPIRPERAAAELRRK
jgi:UDPglucose--hexose-1-phosphate uridylyltransferase